MIIDTESEEGKALVALARFGHDVLHADRWTSPWWLVFNCALEHGMIASADAKTNTVHFSELAKLPEGI